VAKGIRGAKGSLLILHRYAGLRDDLRLEGLSKPDKIIGLPLQPVKRIGCPGDDFAPLDLFHADCNRGFELRILVPLRQDP